MTINRTGLPTLDGRIYSSYRDDAVELWMYGTSPGGSAQAAHPAMAP